MMTSADAVRALVREVLFNEAGDDASNDGPIGPSPLEKLRATGEPVSFKSDISKIKSRVAKVATDVQASPAYKIGTGAYAGGLVGAAKGAGMHVPSALSKPGEFLTRPEISTTIGMMTPVAGSPWRAAFGWGGLAKGVGSGLKQPVSGVEHPIPKFDPVAAYSTPSAVAMSPLAAKDPFKK
jgi:hypothetical protein